MNAAPVASVAVRGAPRLLEHCAIIDRVTAADGPSVKARLECELGLELAEFLVCALADARGAAGSRSV